MASVIIVLCFYYYFACWIRVFKKEDYAGIPWCNADELYYQVDSVTWSIINMELLEENALLLSDSPLLYVHCLDFNSQSYIGSSNLACCRFLTVWGHVSFPKELRERWLCLFVNTERLKDLSNNTSPAVVKVKSSCIHKVSKGYSLNFCFRFHFFFTLWECNLRLWKLSFFEYRLLDQRSFDQKSCCGPNVFTHIRDKIFIGFYAFPST